MLTVISFQGFLFYQTARVSIVPKYKEQYRRSDDYNEVVGYLVRNTLIVTMTEMDIIEDLITKALKSGVNYIDGLEFQTTEYKRYREQARELALIAAKEKAEKMTLVLGLSVGDPIQITENSTYSRSDYGLGRSQVQVQVVTDSSSGNPELIAPGKIAVRANVDVVFKLEE